MPNNNLKGVISSGDVNGFSALGSLDLSGNDLELPAAESCLNFAGCNTGSVECNVDGAFTDPSVVLCEPPPSEPPIAAIAGGAAGAVILVVVAALVAHRQRKKSAPALGAAQGNGTKAAAMTQAVSTLAGDIKADAGNAASASKGQGTNADSDADSARSSSSHDSAQASAKPSRAAAAKRKSIVDRALELVSPAGNRIEKASRRIRTSIERKAKLDVLVSTNAGLDRLLGGSYGLPAEDAAFLVQVLRFERMVAAGLGKKDPDTLKRLAVSLVQEFVDYEAPNMVSLSPPTRSATIKTVSHREPRSFANEKLTILLFSHAKNEVIRRITTGLLKRDARELDKLLDELLDSEKEELEHVEDDENPSVAAIMAVGFGKDDSIRALEMRNGNVEEAVRLLVRGLEAEESSGAEARKQGSGGPGATGAQWKKGSNRSAGARAGEADEVVDEDDLEWASQFLRGRKTRVD